MTDTDTDTETESLRPEIASQTPEDPFDMTAKQLYILAYLGRHGPETGLGVRDGLSDAISCMTERTGVSTPLMALAEAGYVERERDGVGVVNRVTPSGQAALASVTEYLTVSDQGGDGT